MIKSKIHDFKSFTIYLYDDPKDSKNTDGGIKIMNLNFELDYYYFGSGSPKYFNGMYFLNLND